VSAATRTIAVWCPDWPVVAASAVEGIPQHHPAAVLAANRVVACSAAARANGVRRGQRKREAQSRCPELAVLKDDPDRDARAFEPVVCAVEALAPGVEVIRPGLVVVAARGPVNYFGSEQEVAERLIDMVATDVEVECQVGIADGIFAAILAAQRGVLVDPGASAAFLAPLSVTELLQLPDGAPGRAELVDLLRRLGLRTLGSFAALPVSDVSTRFGPDAVQAHRWASGVWDRPLTRRQPPVDLTVTQRLDPPVERVDAAAFAAKEPAARLHELLAARGLACTRLEVYAETEHGEQLSRTWRCAGPLTPGGIYDRVRWQLDAWVSVGASLRSPSLTCHCTQRSVRPCEASDCVGASLRSPSLAPSAGLVLLRLVPDEVVPVATLQRGLWGEVGEADERAGRAMVHVQGILGPDSVFTAVLGGGRDPASQSQLVPWGEQRIPERPPDQPWPGRLPPPSPATVYAPAHRPQAHVLNDAGGHIGVSARAVLTAPPHLVAVDGQPPKAVLGWAGPWPVEERWWDADGGRRLARLQVAVEGAALLLACENGRWLVEGVYD
jgi:protein ImuB